MGTPALKLEIYAPQNSEVSVFRLTDCEWWVGATLQDCIEAAGRMWGMSGEELAEHVEDAYELSDEDLDAMALRADEQGTKQTFREVLNQMRAEGASFPAFFAGLE